MEKSATHQLLERMTQTRLPDNLMPTKNTTANQLADMLSELRKTYEGERHEENFREVFKACVKRYNDKYPDRFDQDVFDSSISGDTIFDKIDKKKYNPANFLQLLFGDKRAEKSLDKTEIEEFDELFSSIMIDFYNASQNEGSYGIYCVMASIIRDRFFDYRNDYVYTVMTKAFYENMKSILPKNSPYYGKKVQSGSGLPEHIVRENIADAVRILNRELGNQPIGDDEFGFDGQPSLKFFVELEYEDFSGLVKKVIVDPDVEYIDKEDGSVSYRPRSHWCGTHYFDSFRVDYWYDRNTKNWVMIPLRLIKSMSIVQDAVDEF